MSEKQVKPFLAQLRELEVGGSIEQPLNKRAYIASACTRFARRYFDIEQFARDLFAYDYTFCDGYVFSDY